MSDITKKAIASTLKELLREKRLTKITVADITERCGINRQTFYYHFQDIYDLVDWIVIRDTEDVLKNNPTYNTWQEGFLTIFEIVKKDKAFIDNIYHSVSFFALQQYLYRVTYPLIKNVVTEKAKEYSVCDNDIEFIVNFYKYAFVGLMLEWINNDMREDPKDIVNRASIIVQGTAEKTLREYTERK